MQVNLSSCYFESNNWFKLISVSGLQLRFSDPADQHENMDVKKTAKQIGIGTNFDGLINAIDRCKQAI